MREDFWEIAGLRALGASVPDGDRGRSVRSRSVALDGGLHGLVLCERPHGEFGLGDE